jgi:FkbM family methyltransferase
VRAGHLRSRLSLDRVRDLARLHWPRGLAFYQRQISPRIGRGDRRQAEFSWWAARGVEITSKLGTRSIRFEQDGIWVADDEGCLWEYKPGVPGSALWAEFGLGHERGEIEVLASHLRPGSLFVDVGANIGSHSIKLSRLVDGLKVLALEPGKAAFETLLRNIAKNDVKGVDARRLAASDHAGTLELTTGLQAENFIVPAGRKMASETVECRTLDELLAESAGSVDALKCDVEGSELSVFRGATRTLERDKPVLLVEVEKRHAGRYGQTGTEMFEFLRGFGYGHQLIVDGTPHPPTGSLETDLAATRNFLFEEATA